VKIRKSKFDNTHTCIFLSDEDEKYASLKPSFKKHGLAFKKDKYIFFDKTELEKKGYFKKSYIYFIEAHEVAHSELGHVQSTPLVEAEADFLAVLLCKEKNLKNSAKIGISQFKNRHKIDFENFSKKYKESVLKKIKK
tara:strand:+ start:134 stop:547 length:414 start_codon:yes stop_codon:yes gene_type:complete